MALPGRTTILPGSVCLRPGKQPGTIAARRFGHFPTARNPRIHEDILGIHPSCGYAGSPEGSHTGDE